MNRRRHWDAEQPPDWFVRAAETAPEPTPADLARHNHLIRELADAIAANQASSASRAAHHAASPVVDAVFSLAGQLVDWARGAVEVIAGSPPPLVPAVVTRSLRSRGSSQATLVGVTKAVGDVTVQVLLTQGKDMLELEMDAYKKGGQSIRPLRVQAHDTTGKPLCPAMDIPAGGVAKFPGPSAGVYMFHVSWAGGSSQLTLEIV